LVLLTQYYLSHQIREDEKGRACSTYWEGGDINTGFWEENLSEGDNLQKYTQTDRQMAVNVPIKQEH
jgi:hypothetical protein